MRAVTDVAFLDCQRTVKVAIPLNNPPLSLKDLPNESAAQRQETRGQYGAQAKPGDSCLGYPPGAPILSPHSAPGLEEQEDETGCHQCIQPHTRLPGSEGLDDATAGIVLIKPGPGSD